MQWLVAAVIVTVRVNLDHQRKTFDPLLRGEVCAQTVDCDEDLPETHRGEEGEILEKCFHSFVHNFKHPQQPKILTVQTEASP